MIKKILEKMIIISGIVILVCLIFLIRTKKIEQPQTFYQLKSYQLAKYSIGTWGGICYEYANRMKRLFPEVQKEHIIIKYRGFDTLAHYRIILFENDNLIIYTDSNYMGYQIIRTWFEWK